MFCAVFNKLGKGPAFMVILGELCPEKLKQNLGDNIESHRVRSKSLFNQVFVSFGFVYTDFEIRCVYVY